MQSFKLIPAMSCKRIIFLSLLSCLACVSCNQITSSNTGKTSEKVFHVSDYPELIKGKWRHSHVVLMGDTTDIREEMESYMVFGENGKYETGGKVNGEEHWGVSSYEVKEDKLIISGEFQIHTLTDTILITSLSGDSTYIAIYQKVD